jgi:hypothetical protein
LTLTDGANEHLEGFDMVAANRRKAKSWIEVPLDEAERLPNSGKNHVCVYTVADPRNAGRNITNVLCRYRLAGGEVTFQKSPIDSGDSFEDALAWAKSFARLHGIENIYASNHAADA